MGGNEDIFAALAAKPFRERRYWNPAVGDELAGTLIEERQKEGEEDGKFLPVVVIRDAQDVEWTYWVTTAYLLAEWRRQAPAIGDRIGLRRDPDVPGKGFTRKIITLVVISASSSGGKAA